MSEFLDPATARAIERLVHEHAWLIDHGQASRVVDLYTEDGRVLGIGPDKVGRAAIAAWADARQAMADRQSRHVQTNLRLVQASDSTVHGTVVLTLYRHDGPGPASPIPLLVGEYADTYTNGPDGTWRFAERHLAVLFGRPPCVPPAAAVPAPARA